MPLRFSPPGGASALALKSLVRGAPGVDGDDGSLLFEQNSAPATDKPANSLWIDSDSTDLDVYQLVSSVWTDTGINLKGTPGTAATIAAGTTTTAAEGSSAAVANSGSSSAAVFDFTIPRGAAPAVGYTFSTTTTDSDPGNGIVRFNNATPASITTIYFDNQDADGNTVTAWLDTFDDSTDTSSKGFLTFTDVASPSTKIGFNVTGSSVVDGTGYRKVTVTHSFGTTLFTNAHRLAVTFDRTGNKGTDGAGTGDVSSSSNFTADNRLVRTDRPTSDNKNVQQSGISVDDSDNVSGIGTLSAARHYGQDSGTSADTLYSGRFVSTRPAASGQHINLVRSGNKVFSIGYDYNTNNFAVGFGQSTDSSFTSTQLALTIDGSTLDLSIGTSRVFTCGTIELGHASANTLSASSGVLSIEGVQVLKANGSQTVTGGFSLTPYNIGTVSSGTTTPAAANGNYQYMTNNGAHTLAAPSSDCAIDILVTNGASAGSITFSGFTVGSSTGSTYATTNTNKYLLSIRRINSVSTYSWYALQ